MNADAPELRLVHQWLDIAVGVERFGFRLALTHVAEHEWRAAFVTGDTMVAPAGFGVAPTPWRAVQQAAWLVLR